MNETGLREWIGRSVTTQDTLTAFPANALAATLDREETAYDEGDALPPLWHWLYFLPVYKLCEAGYDGHAALGGFLPPVPLPRRMWAGGRLRFHAPLRIGRRLTKTSTIKDVSMKTGRSGPLAFVTVTHRVLDGDSLCLEEDHEIVYRAPPAPSDPPRPPKQAPGQSAFSRDIDPSPVLLFRYSALTFNGHRIHYDRPFCTQTEGYEGLVVHGPLLATFLLDLLRHQYPARAVRDFSFRALAPVYDTAPFSVHGTPDDGGVALWVRREDGGLAMSGRATLEAEN